MSEMKILRCASKLNRPTVLTTEKRILDSSSLMRTTGMESGFASAHFSRESPDCAESSNATETNFAGLGCLNGESFTHDGAATSNGLQIGHATTTWRGMTSRGGEGAKSCR
jgi:hypothetical protein